MGIYFVITVILYDCCSLTVYNRTSLNRHIYVYIHIIRILLLLIIIMLNSVHKRYILRKVLLYSTSVFLNGIPTTTQCLDGQRTLPIGIQVCQCTRLLPIGWEPRAIPTRPSIADACPLTPNVPQRVEPVFQKKMYGIHTCE